MEISIEYCNTRNNSTKDMVWKYLRKYKTYIAPLEDELFTDCSLFAAVARYLLLFLAFLLITHINSLIVAPNYYTSDT